MPKPLTEEEKKEQVARFFAQKRESFAQGILFNLCQNPSAPLSDEKALVDFSLKAADCLVEKLYLVKPDEQGE